MASLAWAARSQRMATESLPTDTALAPSLARARPVTADMWPVRVCASLGRDRWKGQLLIGFLLGGGQVPAEEAAGGEAPVQE